MSINCIFYARDRKLWPVGPARLHRLGAQEHPLIWWRPRKHHHLWRVCRWCKCQLPGEDKKAKNMEELVIKQGVSVI